MTEGNANPYVGPRTFEEKDSQYFFGRDREANELLSLIISEPLVLFYAQSGAGKSSLLNTHLIPELRAEGFNILPVGRVSGGLPEGVSQVPNIFVFNLLLSLDVSDSEDKAAHLAQATLTDYLQAHASKVADVDEEIDFDEPPRVLVIDQFEEIVTTHLDHWPERRDFFRQLKQAMVDDPLLWVVLAMREDYIAALEPYARLLPNNLRIHYRMPRMGHQAALEAIERPAEHAGRPFGQGVAQKLVDNLRQIRTYDKEKSQLGQFVEPVQLQVVCYQLWENLRDRPPGEITLEDVQRLGNVDRALGDFYEQAIGAALEKTGVSEIYLRDWFQAKLITEAGTRGTVFRGPNKTEGLANQTVDLLAAQFILRAEIRAGGTWYELVHDRFVEPILQSNQAWREELLRQSPLIQAAQIWADSDRDPAKLYEGQQLENALVGLNLENQEPLVQEFLAASDEAKRAKELAEANRQAKRLRRTITGLGILLLVAVGAAIFALYQRSLAQTNAAKADEARLAAEAQRINAVDAKILAETKGAEAERRRSEAEASRAEADALRNQVEQQARSRQLATQAMEVLNKQPNLALLLSGAANEITRTLESRSSLLEALQYSTNLGRYLEGHTNRVWSAAFSPDGQLLATAGDDGRILLWDVTSGQLHGGLPADPTANVYSLAFSPDGAILASGDNSNTITLWNVKKRQQLGQPLIGHIGSIFSVAFSPDGRVLASGSADETIILWDVSSGRPLGPAGGRLTGHSDWVWQVAFSPDSQSLASASRDHTVRLWDIATQQPIGQPFGGHTNTVASVAFSPNGQTIASGDGFGEIFLWDVATQLPLGEPFIEQPNTVWGLVFSPDNRSLISSSGEGKIIVWDLKKWQPLDQDNDLQPDFDLVGHEDWVYRLALSPDGRTLASPGGDQSVILWDLTARSRLARLLTQHTTDIWSVAYSPGGEIIAFGTRNGRVGFWNVGQNQQLGPLQHRHKGGVNCVTFSPDGNILASASEDDSIILWDVATQQPLGPPLLGHEDNVSSAAFSPDSQTLASSSVDGAIVLWDVATHEVLDKPLKEGRPSVNGVAFSPDGLRLAAADNDSNVIIWDLETRQPVQSLGPHGERVYTVTFSPDGKLLAAGTLGGLVTLWDPNSAETLWNFTGHSRAVYSMAFSPDSQTLATASADKSIMLWDVPSRRRLGQPLAGHDLRVWSVAFSPDGQSLASGGADGKILQWALNFEAWLDNACSLVNRNLSVSEWEPFFRNEPYRKICPRAPLHPSLIELGADRIAAGDDANGEILDFVAADARSELESEVKLLMARQLSGSGWISARAGQTEEAISHFRQALELDPTLEFEPETQAQQLLVQYLVKEGYSLAKAGNLVEAITTFEQALKLEPSLDIEPEATARQQLTEALLEKARSFAGTDNFDNAVPYLQLAQYYDPTLRFDPEQEARRLAAQALIERGQALAGKGDVETALTTYAEATALDPDLVISASAWEILCHGGADPDTAALALEACDTAVALAPKAAWTHNSRSQVRALLGDLEGTVEDLRFVLGRLEENELYEPDRMLLDSWLAKLEAGFNPLAAHILVEKGKDLVAASEYGQARTLFEEAKELDPSIELNPPWADLLLAEGGALARAGQLRAAQANLREALALDPQLELDPIKETHRIAAESQLERGRSLIERGQFEQAGRHLERAQTLNPELELNLAAETVARGQIMAHQGQIEAALSLYEQAQQLDPTLEIPAEAWHTLCYAGSLWGSAADVMEICEQAVALAPNASWARYGRGLARALTGDRIGAITDFSFIMERLQENELYQVDSSPIEGWLADLEAGRNPFNEVTLEKLRRELD